MRLAKLLALVLALQSPASAHQESKPEDLRAFAERMEREFDTARIALEKGELAEARSRADSAVRALAQRSEAPATEWLAQTAYNLGMVAWNAESPRTALDAWRITRAYFDAHPPKDVGRLLTLHGNLGAALYAAGELAEARELLPPHLERCERELGPEHDLTLQAKLNLAQVHGGLGDHQRAGELEQEVLEVYERTLDPKDVRLLQTRGNHAATLIDAGEFAAARALLEDTVAAGEIALPRDHALLQGWRTTLGRALAKLGDHRGARDLYEQALLAYERMLPPEHRDLHGARVNLANALHVLGDVVRARVLLEAATDGLARVLSPEHPDAISARMSLAATMHAQGDFQAARAAYEDVLAARRRAGTPDAAAILRVKNNLGALLSTSGELDAALALQESVVAELAARGRAAEDELVEARTNLALLFERMERHEDAEKLARAVLDATKALADDAPQRRAARWTLATAMRSLGRFDAARELQEDVLRSSKELEDGATLSPGYARTLALLDDRAALDAWSREEAVRLRSTLRELERQSDREALERAERELDALATLVSFAPAEMESELFELAQRLRSRATTRGATVVAGDPAREPAVQRLRELRARIQDLVVGSDRKSGDSERLGALVRERDGLERELFTGADAALVVVTPRTLAPALPEHGAVVAFQVLRRPRVVDGAPRRIETREELLAWVVRPDASITRIELGPMDRVRAAVELWRSAVGKPVQRGTAVKNAGSDAMQSGRALRALVLDPVLAETKSAKVLHVVVDDALELVPIDALPLDSAETALVGDGVWMRMELSLDRLLVPPPAHGIEKGTLVAIGGVDFNARHESSQVLPVEATAPSIAPSVVSETSTPSRAAAALVAWDPLPETRGEAAGIAELFQNEFEREPVLLSGKAASKRAFFDAARNARFLHVATHGWFAAAAGAAANTGDDLLSRSFVERARGLAPLALCGLAFAGANRGLDPHGRAPGLLTGEELAGTDLSNCELAVLSACETNVGIARAGRGLQSLRSALARAGAHASITSLWRVDDLHTRALFSSFYARIWVDREPVHVALWKAKQALRASGAPTRDWAGWVLVGAR